MLGWSKMVTGVRTNGRKTGSLYRAMPEAGATKSSSSTLKIRARLFKASLA